MYLNARASRCICSLLLHCSHFSSTPPLYLYAGVYCIFRLQSTCISVFGIAYMFLYFGVSGSSCTCSLFSLLSQSILCTTGRRGVNNPLFQHRPQKSLAQIQNSTQLHIPDTDENTDTLLFSNVLTLAYAVPNTGHQPCLKSYFQENLIRSESLFSL